MMPADASSSLSIRLFGPFEPRLPDGSLLPLRSRKEQWLLALLALQHGRPRERAWLAGMLWPDSSPTQSLANLRNCLASLRRALGPEAHRLGSPTPRTLVLDLTGAEVDVLAFDAAIARGDEPSLALAVSLYRSTLLEECTEAWALPEREKREQSFLQALEQLAACAVNRSARGEAEGYLRRAIEVDPLRESAQRGLMRVLVEGGNEAAALEVYRELRILLHRELNAAPDPETTALFQSLRSRSSHLALGSPGRTPPAHNLPGQLTRFIGRAREIAEVRNLLATARLLTLTGAGGCGKTRLALQVAAGLVDAYPDGLWVVQLAPLADPALVPQTVAAVLQVREEPGWPLVQTLIEALRGRQMLLVLDNCDYLLTACAGLAEDLLRSCPHLCILGTSRERLGIGGEQLYRVPSLSLPEPGLRPSLEDMRASEAIQLFVDRARLTEPGFTLTEVNGPAVAQVCHRLDGIPLAIELAAARVKALPVEVLAERLNDPFRLLACGNRTALPRHQTLRGVIDWSYDLLSAAERRLLRRLSVFAGGWRLEAAEAVCSGEGTEKWEVLDRLTALVEKSLVVYEGKGAETRYRLLETIRHYARERLAASGEAAAIGRQHAQFFLTLAEEAEPKLRTADRRVWLDKIHREHDNMRAALAWSHGEPEAREIELRLAGALWRFWYLCNNYLTEGRQWLEGALAGIGAEKREEEVGFTRARAKVLYGSGIIVGYYGDPASAQRPLEESVALWRALGDKYWLASALRDLGALTDAVPLLEESLALCRELGDRYGVLHSLFHLGNAALRLSDRETGRSCYSESVAIGRELGDKWSLARPLAGLGRCALLQDDYDAARVLFEESVLLRRQEPDAYLPGFLRDLGYIALQQRDFEGARAAFEEALIHADEAVIHAPKTVGRDARACLLSDVGTVARCQGDEKAARSFCEQSQAAFQELLGQEWGWAARSGAREAVPRTTGQETEKRRELARCLEGLAAVAVTRGEMARAARLLGAAASFHDTSSMRSPLSTAEHAQHEGNLAAARAALGEEGFAAAWAAGRALSLEDAVALAVEPADPQ